MRKVEKSEVVGELKRQFPQDHKVLSDENVDKVVGKINNAVSEGWMQQKMEFMTVEKDRFIRYVFDVSWLLRDSLKF